MSTQTNLVVSKLKTILADVTITGAVLNAGALRFTGTHAYEIGDLISVSGVTGAVEANRVFVDTVTEKVEGKDVEIPTLDAIKSRFGAAAFSTPELKTPAQLAELGPAAKEFVKEYAYMPVTGLTVALTEDKRVGIKPTSATERLGLDAIQNAIATAS